jgi:hypothetical protein
MSIRADIEKEMSVSNIKMKYWPEPSVYRFKIRAPNLFVVFAAMLNCDDIIEFKYEHGCFDITISGFSDEAQHLLELSKQHPHSCAYIMDERNSDQSDPEYGIAGWKFLNSFESEAV